MNKNQLHIPFNPAEFYKDEWKGWADFFEKEPIQKWTNINILEFLHSIESELEFLEPIEILTIIDQSGSKDLRNNKNFKSLLQTESSSIERKVALEKLKNEFENKATKDGESEQKNINEVLDETNNQNKKIIESEHIETLLKEQQAKASKEKNPEEFFKYTYINQLKAYDNTKIAHTLDHEAIEFLIKFRIDKLWNDVMSNDYNIEVLRNEPGGKYFTLIKTRFLLEYDKVLEIQVPHDYCFKDNNGNLAQPNLMQKLVVHRLLDRKHYGNWSSMGSGKTLSAILAGRIGNLKNTLIVTFNANVDDWESSILNAFPENTNILNKEKVHISLEKDKFNYILFNYESFQGSEMTDAIVSAIASNDIDYIVLDEVQLVKQRDEETCSNRRKVIDSLIKNIECKNLKNSKDTYKLVMSATPVINNLTEPKKIIELLKGERYNDIKSFPNINNALHIHRQLFINGVRFQPKYNIEVDTKFPKINGNHLTYLYLNTPREKILNLEQIFIPDKLLEIKNHLERGTMIYTHYVTGIVDKIKSFVESCGFTVGIYTGQEKVGLTCFKKGKCDILICSSAIGIGVDGLQRICNKLIVMNLPWTNSEYENLVARLARQGSSYNKIKVIIPQVEITYNNNTYSWDVERMNRIKNKRTLSNVALDGIIPEHLVPTPAKMLSQSKDRFKKWIERIQNEGLIQIDREKALVCVDDELLEIKQETDIELEDIKIKKYNRIISETGINRSMLNSKQKNLIEKAKSKNTIPIRIDESLIVYVDDESKIEAVKKKYGLSE